MFGNQCKLVWLKVILDMDMQMQLKCTLYSAQLFRKTRSLLIMDSQMYSHQLVDSQFLSKEQLFWSMALYSVKWLKDNLPKCSIAIVKFKLKQKQMKERKKKKKKLKTGRTMLLTKLERSNLRFLPRSKTKELISLTKKKMMKTIWLTTSLLNLATMVRMSTLSRLKQSLICFKTSSSKCGNPSKAMIKFLVN